MPRPCAASSCRRCGTRILPPLSNETITLVKDTSSIYVLALNDLLRAARGMVQRDFTFTPFIVAACFYLGMTLMLTWVFQYLERRYARFDAKSHPSTPPPR